VAATGGRIETNDKRSAGPPPKTLGRGRRISQ
jgi:hypothetical protein